ncbi:MAG: hypothetical protein ACTSWW_02190 [Promethearchaeota archaeon]
MPGASPQQKFMPRGSCPYCGHEQYLIYPNVKPWDNIYFIEKKEENIITDSFSEVVTQAVCQQCQKTFHFIHNLSESTMQRKKHNPA